ncbi:MAG TPA: MBL fold metallo-hydrolase [Sphaerochaeta sp.]|nr:MBL fold metallo-hydrolase [Sphaerochaeta sp.]
MRTWAVLGSGSSGNSYLFSDGSSAILIDQGYSVASLKRRLAHFSTTVEAVEAVFVTHLHPDHVRGVGILARMHHVPVWMHTKAVEAQRQVVSNLNIPAGLLHTVDPFEVIEVGPFSVFCFETSHDSAGSVGWVVAHEGRQYMVLTDAGVTDEVQRSLAREAEVLFLEANYDREMLKNGPYPPPLKARIASKGGHLSNDEALTFLAESGFSGSHVYFIHISDTNNSVPLLEAAARISSPVPFTVCAKGACYGVVGS